MWRYHVGSIEVLLLRLNDVDTNLQTQASLTQLSTPASENDYSLDNLTRWAKAGRPDRPPFGLHRDLFSLQSTALLKEGIARAAEELEMPIDEIDPHLAILSHRFSHQKTGNEALVPAHVVTVVCLGDLLMLGPNFLSVGHSVVSSAPFGDARRKQQVIGCLLNDVVHSNALAEPLKDRFRMRDTLFCVSLPFQKRDRFGLAGSVLAGLGGRHVRWDRQKPIPSQPGRTCYFFTSQADDRAFLRRDVLHLGGATLRAWHANYLRVAAAGKPSEAISAEHARQILGLLQNADFVTPARFQPPSPDEAPAVAAVVQ
jgi:hypothetical protein